MNSNKINNLVFFNSDANKNDHKRSIFISCLKFKNQAPYLIINCEKLIEDNNFENIYEYLQTIKQIIIDNNLREGLREIANILKKLAAINSNYNDY